MAMLSNVCSYVIPLDEFAALHQRLGHLNLLQLQHVNTRLRTRHCAISPNNPTEVTSPLHNTVWLYKLS